MFWTLIIILVISMQPRKLTQVINLRFKRNEARPRICCCICSRILTGNGNIAPYADSPQIPLLMALDLLSLGGRRKWKERRAANTPRVPCPSKQAMKKFIETHCSTKVILNEQNAKEDHGDTASECLKKAYSHVIIEPGVSQLPGHHHCETLVPCQGGIEERE